MKMSNFENPTWRTAAILKIVIAPYLSRQKFEFDEIWYIDANIEQGDENMRKIQKFPNSRWRTDVILKIIFGYNSAPYCPIKTKFGMRRHNRTHTKVRWWKCWISKIQHGGRPPFWKSLYLHISAANCPNFTKLSMQTQILTQAMETWQQKNQKFPNSRWRTTPYRKSFFFAYNSAPSCPIKTKFAVWMHNRTHTKVRWWKCPISKIQHVIRPPFWKSLYLHISAANRPNCTKFSMQTKILPQATKKTKNQKVTNSKWRMYAALKSLYWL